MRKALIFAMALVAALTSCSNKDKKALAEQEALNNATREELMQAISERDQLLDLINEITATTEQIKNVENIVSINRDETETPAQTSQINSNLDAIKATLDDRAKKLAQLEKTLRNSKSENSKLLKTIEDLKAQIAQQSTTIDNLSQRLLDANTQISELGTKVSNLTTEVSEVTEQRDQAQAEVRRQTDLANACYYAIGSKKELKEFNIIEGGGFLKKEKILQGDFDKSYFTQGDKRTLRTIELHSNKAKVITTTQPKNSYEIVDVNGQKVLNILNPSEFWGTSNFLVVQID